MAKKPSAGQLFYKVAFDAREPIEDEYGNVVEGWQEKFVCRAGFTHLRGGESVIASRLEGKHIQIITVRVSTLSKAVTTDYRARDVRTGETFNIRDITPNLDRQFIDFLVESGVADG
mgnify:CR=1 FL=1